MRLYRLTVADLAKARAESTNLDLIENLNALVVQAYAAIYRPKPRRGLSLIMEAFVFGAQAFRRQFRFIVAALFVMAFFAGLSATLLATRPDLRAHLISPGEEELFDHWKKGQFEYRSAEEAAQMWSFYASNNPVVTVVFAAGGAGTFGVYSYYGMSRTGVQLGALSYEMNTVGKLPFLLSSIAPHGASELSGAVISGGVGFLMGWTVLFPGRRNRLDALRRVSLDALALFLMAIGMMYIAAPVEGFFSFRPEVPQELKAIVGAIVFAGWCCYWVFAGRNREPLFIPVDEMPAAEENSLQFAKGS